MDGWESTTLETCSDQVNFINTPRQDANTQYEVELGETSRRLKESPKAIGNMKLGSPRQAPGTHWQTGLRTKAP